jgi:hypothetical protein
MKTIISIILLASLFFSMSISCKDSIDPSDDSEKPDGKNKPEVIKKLSKPQFRLWGNANGIGQYNLTLNNSQLKTLAEAFYLIQNWSSKAGSESYMKVINPEIKFLGYMNSTYVPNNPDSWDHVGPEVPETYKHAIAMTPVAWIYSSISENQTTFQVFRAYNNGNKRPITDDIAILASTVDGDYSASDETGSQHYVFWIRTGEELMKVVNYNKSTGEITVTRGFNNTVPTSHDAGSLVFSPIYIGSQPGSKLAAPGSNDIGLRYALDPQITDGNILRARRAEKIVSASDIDGIWLDIYPPSFFNMADILKREVKPWDFLKDTVYKRDDWRHYQEIKAAYLREYVFQRTGKYPVIVGNNQNPEYYFEGDGGSRLYLMPTEVKPIPLDGMCNEGIFKRTLSEHWGWKSAMKMFLDAAKYDLAVMPIQGDAGGHAHNGDWPDTPERDRIERYGYATFLLAVEKNLKMMMGTYPFYKNARGEPFFKIHPQYYWYVGDPLETINYDEIDNHLVSGTQVYKREFSNALILVNPGTITENVNLGIEYLDPDNGLWKSELELPAASGKIMLKRNITSE